MASVGAFTQSTIHATLGAIFVGYSVASIVFGIVLTQVSQDHFLLRGFIGHLTRLGADLCLLQKLSRR